MFSKLEVSSLNLSKQKLMLEKKNQVGIGDGSYSLDGSMRCIWLAYDYPGIYP